MGFVFQERVHMMLSLQGKEYAVLTNNEDEEVGERRAPK